MQRLQRILGPITAFLIGLGVAIGSGIFRTPGQIAGALNSPGFILLAWLFGGFFVLASSLVSAELATRFPMAGGEYVYLRKAFGDFPAFFFGWGYSVFIIGGGAAIIASAFGEALTELTGAPVSYKNAFAIGAIVTITGVNVIGLKAGAGLQNGLTALKIVALLGFAVVAAIFGNGNTEWTAPIRLNQQHSSAFVAFLAVLPPVLWTYEGTTDAVKMAEEIKDVRRDLPRALVGSALTLTILYLLVNVACMMAMTPAEMGQHRFVPNAIVAKLFGSTGHKVMVVLALIVLAGSLSSTVLATVRVTFALARDGFAPRRLGTMSKNQAPVTALISVACVSTLFCAFRDFEQILGIYFLAAAVLFGLAYASLLVFRARDPRPDGVFLCPAGPVVAIMLILVQVAMATLIVFERPNDSFYTLLLLVVVAGAYGVRSMFAKS